MQFSFQLAILLCKRVIHSSSAVVMHTLIIYHMYILCVILY